MKQPSPATKMRTATPATHAAVVAPADSLSFGNLLSTRAALTDWTTWIIIAFGTAALVSIPVERTTVGGRWVYAAARLDR